MFWVIPKIYHLGKGKGITWVLCSKKALLIIDKEAWEILFIEKVQQYFLFNKIQNLYQQDGVLQKSEQR